MLIMKEGQPMEYVNYRQQYEGQVVDLWNRCCTFDPLDVHKFRRQALLDDNFDPALAWVCLDQDRVIGFLYGTKRKFPYLERGLEPERGWINVICVDPEHRGQGVGQHLYDLAENALKALGCRNITLGAYSPSYFFWGLDPVHYPEAIAFFEKNGYQGREHHYSMGKDLHGFQIPADTLRRKQEAEAKGYRFISFDYSYCLELLEFLKVQFGGGWKRNALISMQNGTAEDCILLVLDPKGAVCGFCMRAIDGNPMRFGPIGVAKDLRNLGIGSILLDLGCYEMEKKGIYRMYFITTDDAGRRYYERHQLSVIREFVDYRKEIA